jgi:signal transduction histidine kinase/CheY-like chemotaxis protein/HPt (histidine-containing phosphotransfer) domain-containing protein
MADHPIFESFLADQGYALFEYLGDGAFRPVGHLPEWLEKTWCPTSGREKTIRLAEQSPFVENFLVDAESFWNSKRKEAVNSGIWMERNDAGREVPFEAWALRLDGKPVLVVRNLSDTYAERQQLYQTARDSLLEHERLIREVQKKEILLHCIIHDLSQPLNAMRGCFNILGMEKLPGEQRRMVETGQRESQRQEQMIRGILEAFSGDLAAQQTPAGATSEAPDLAACAQRVIEQFSPAFTEKGIGLRLDPHLDVSCEWKVAGDASRLERIFGNLLENAMRYTPKGSTVTVGIEDKVHCLLAFVDDEGPGLPKDATPDRLFALFSKGKDRPGKAGLGLYFCKITVERWGGSIGAENRPGGGSRFWFKIPRTMKTPANRSSEKSRIAEAPKEPAAQEQPALAPSLRAGKAAKRLRILVAEDMDVNRELVTELLEKRGHSVVGAGDGRAALAALAKQPFDVVLMDEQMPGMDGLEATRAIRQMEASSGKHQIIIGLTGNVAEEDKKRRSEAGMDGAIAKPFDMHVLFQMVESHSPGASQAVAAAPAPAPSAPASENVAEHLQRTTGGNEKLIRSLVKSFLTDAPKKLSGIRRAVSQKNAAKLVSTAHAFKGAAAIFGPSNGAVTAARNLEAMGKAGNLQDAKKELRTLEEEFAGLQRELLALQSKKKQKQAVPTGRRK